jgi:hypothetical protein
MIKMIFLLFIITPYSHAQVLQEKECSPVDIRDTNPKISKSPSLRKFFSTPRDQGEIGWCYGFAAADLLSAHLGADISGFHVAAIHNSAARKNPRRWYLQEKIGKKIHQVHDWNEEPLAMRQETYEGAPMVHNKSYSPLALRDVMKHGYVCRENDLPFDPVHTSRFIYVLEFIRATRKDIRKSGGLSEDQLCAISQKLEPLNLALDASEIIEMTLSKDLNHTLAQIAKAQCKHEAVIVPRFKVKEMPTIQQSKKTNSKEFLSNISNLLANGKPVEVTYNTNEYTEVSGMHSSIVVARRWHNGKCQFKIRNSWGKSCALYKSTVDCEEETGSFWVNDEHFAKATRSSYYIE